MNHSSLVTDPPHASIDLPCGTQNNQTFPPLTMKQEACQLSHGRAAMENKTGMTGH